ncbi:hypothetical protein CDAR_71902 [Caerostris darwini]|uniref:Secreted protein n=1 Tax=Caerostris darwini TaxID=1538125 RepID=A0AAV4TJV2_9ARAC|nr:hypothetical protein CDAR_71902 [Caerostris darwini]
MACVRHLLLASGLGSEAAIDSPGAKNQNQRSQTYHRLPSVLLAIPSSRCVCARVVEDSGSRWIKTVNRIRNGFVFVQMSKRCMVFTGVDRIELVEERTSVGFRHG